MPRSLTQDRVEEIRREAQYITACTLAGSERKTIAGDFRSARTIIKLCDHADSLQDLLKRWIDLMSVYPAVEGEFTYLLDVEGAELLKETRAVLPED